MPALDRYFRRSVAVALVAGSAAFGAAGCATVSSQQEAQLGAQAAAQANEQLPIVQDAQLNSYINALGRQIAAQGPRRDVAWHFYIVNSNVVNAMSLPGGYVYVNRGIIEHASNMSELAGVMAHEIGHVEERHSVQQLERVQNANLGLGLASILLGIQPSGVAGAAIQIGGQAIFARYSRQDESEADADAVLLTTRAGISPEGLVTFFQKLLQMQQSQPGLLDQWFATHPTTEQRITDVKQEIQQQVPASTLSRLQTDSDAFHTFKSRMARYPAPPPGANGQ